MIEHNGNIISRDVISDLHTTEFRMMLTLMVKVMQEIPDGSDILFLTNAALLHGRTTRLFRRPSRATESRPSRRNICGH